MPWPIACVALNTSMKPSPETLTVTRSSNALPLVHSRNEAMPRPRNLPARFEASARASKPAQSASASAWACTDSNWPLS